MSLLLKLKNFAMIEELEIQESDLTFFIGEQGTGKSLVLQLIKLLKDKNHIRKTFEQYGFAWRETEQNLNLFYGDGMSEIWRDDTEVEFLNKAFKKKDLQPKRRETYKEAQETIFYIPAQRVVCLEDGWPRYFTSYSTSTPYVMRHFSETLRQLLEEILSNKEQNQLFPISNRLDQVTRASLEQSIYNQNSLTIESQGGKKNVRMKVGNNSIPFMTWSAGQKEFFPLLLALYWLCPPARVPRKDQLEIVIIEEPEMGLHPDAIHAVFIQILELLNRDYKVYVSTHSANFLEYLWVFQEIKKRRDEIKALEAFTDFMRLPRGTTKTRGLFKASRKKTKIYYFQREKTKVKIKDISELDVGSEDKAISEWGHLLSLSQKASEIIAGLVD